ncbi:MAG: hypothetical protein L0322_25205 [Chloroflexi bacterium]|nr:hypothetical protein [Chloroflexota bacterium]MCI0575895.1 hypothetical protein [Chloroflexota bacterium]MCI0648310.1 hypothetical protein [Chloroflexota bacterium]
MSKSTIGIQTEQIDDIPLLLAMLHKMKLQTIVDSIINPHGNRQGLSIGWTMVVWLSHILIQ